MADVAWVAVLRDCTPLGLHHSSSGGGSPSHWVGDLPVYGRSGGCNCPMGPCYRPKMLKRSTMAHSRVTVYIVQ